MGFTVLSQQLLFAYSLAFGAFLSLVYCVLRIFRNLLSSFPIAVFAFDLFYFVFTAVAAVIFIFVVNNGEIRIYIIASAVLGWLLFFLSVGRLMSYVVKKSSEKFGKKCRKDLK